MRLHLLSHPRGPTRIGRSLPRKAATSNTCRLCSPREFHDAPASTPRGRPLGASATSEAEVR